MLFIITITSTGSWLKRAILQAGWSKVTQADESHGHVGHGLGRYIGQNQEGEDSTDCFFAAVTFLQFHGHHFFCLHACLKKNFEKLCTPLHIFKFTSKSFILS